MKVAASQISGLTINGSGRLNILDLQGGSDLSKTSDVEVFVEISADTNFSGKLPSDIKFNIAKPSSGINTLTINAKDITGRTLIGGHKVYIKNKEMNLNNWNYLIVDDDAAPQRYKSSEIDLDDQSNIVWLGEGDDYNKRFKIAQLSTGTPNKTFKLKNMDNTAIQSPTTIPSESPYTEVVILNNTVQLIINLDSDTTSLDLSEVYMHDEKVVSGSRVDLIYINIPATKI